MALRSVLGTDMPTVAKMLQAHGRGRDRILAHITAEEAALLKARGGRGSRNPATGLLEFDDLPPEVVTVNAPAPIPAISAPPPVYTPAPKAPAPTANNAPETVTVTGTQPAASTVTSAPLPDLSAPLEAAPRAAPLAPAPATASAPAAPIGNAAPETVTVPGTSTAPAIPYSETTDISRQSIPVDQGPGIGQRTKDFLGNNAVLLSLLGLGGLGFLGARTSAAAGKQGQQLQKQLASLGQPLANVGNQELNTTLSGGLTPSSMRALQAVQAQLGQGEAMGAVSAQQAAQAISGTFAQLMQNQLQEALGILNTADSYLQNAYLQGYQANTATQTNTANFYTNLANLAARLGGFGGSTTITIPGSGANA